MKRLGLAAAATAALVASVAAPPTAHAQGTVQAETSYNFSVNCVDAVCSNFAADAVQSYTPSATAQVSLPNGSFGRTDGTFAGALQAPVLQSWSNSEAVNNFSHAYVGMLQGYTWTGEDPATINWVAELDYFRPPGGSGSNVSAAFWLLDGSFVPAANPFQNIAPLDTIQNNPFNGAVVPCDGSHPGILGFAMFSNLAVSPGAGSATLSLGSTCSGSPFVAEAGQEFYLYTTLVTNAVGGAETDAFHSLHVGLSPDTSPEDAARIARFLVPTAVPEPATWAVMVLGLGTVGAVLRRRRRYETSAIHPLQTSRKAACGQGECGWAMRFFPLQTH